MNMRPPPADGPTFETYHRRRGRREALIRVVVGVGIGYTLLRWKPFRVEVSGPSMSPALMPGDWALAVRPGRVRRRDVVVVEHPGRPGFELVKRVVAVPGERAPHGAILGPGEWWVEGDSSGQSTDSRHFGLVRTEQLRATVRLIYWPPSRWGLLGGPLWRTRSRG
jgi:signal peptidase I